MPPNPNRASQVLVDNIVRELVRSVRTFPARQLMMIRQVGRGASDADSIPPLLRDDHVHSIPSCMTTMSIRYPPSCMTTMSTAPWPHKQPGRTPGAITAHVPTHRVFYAPTHNYTYACTHTHTHTHAHTHTSTDMTQMSDTNRVLHNSAPPPELAGMTTFRPFRGTWDTIRAVGPLGLWTGKAALC